MTRTTRFFLTLALAAPLATTAMAKPLAADADPQSSVDRVSTSRDIDLVVALDTSGSMDGLLDTAKARLWDIVNAASDKDPEARIRVALITFGDSAGGADEINLRSDLTTDLDSLYGEIMSLDTSGGTELVGMTLNTALTDLSWSDQRNAAKIVFVAGNESADQGRNRHDYRRVARRAREKGIVVNAMFAGDHQQGIHEQWSNVAELGGGIYSAFSQASGTHQIATPQDQKLAELNDRLNATYVGYGTRGAEGKQNQMAQDRNAASMGAGSVGSRVSAKSKAAYDNASWDVVDGVDKGDLDVETAAAEALPEPMRDMSAEERTAFVSELKEKREAIQKEIDEVSKKRTRFLRQKAEESEEAGLDDVVVEALDKQL